VLGVEESSVLRCVDDVTADNVGEKMTSFESRSRPSFTANR